MGAGNFLVGVGATVLMSFLKPNTWCLLNVETKEMVGGDFPHDEMGREVKSNYASINSLNRQSPIVQFLNGDSQTLSVKSRFRYGDITDDPPTKKLEQIIKWSQLDPIVRRPPVCIFSLGVGTGATWQVVVTGVSGIEYSITDFLGTVREITFTMNLMMYTPFSLDQTQATDTRYARAKQRDYYELLAQQEYGNPMLGVVIRQRHPRQPLLAPGNIVTLPSVEGVRTIVPQQASLQLKDAYSKRDTAARRLRQQWFDKRATPYTSFIVNIVPRS